MTKVEENPLAVEPHTAASTTDDEESIDYYLK